MVTESGKSATKTLSEAVLREEPKPYGRPEGPGAASIKGGSSGVSAVSILWQPKLSLKC